MSKEKKINLTQEKNKPGQKFRFQVWDEYGAKDSILIVEATSSNEAEKKIKLRKNWTYKILTEKEK